ncbi:MAG: helix-turn-helix transcriptional regulator [Pacificimonas sp.]
MNIRGEHGAQLEAAYGGIINGALLRSRMSQRRLSQKTGITKDTLSRMMSEKRRVQTGEAVQLLEALGAPARGIVVLSLFDQHALIEDWTATEAAEFLETLIETLPAALEAELGDDLDMIRSRWGKPTAHLIAKRISKHIAEAARHEEMMGDDDVGRIRAVGA